MGDEVTEDSEQEPLQGSTQRGQNASGVVNDHEEADIGTQEILVFNHDTTTPHSAPPGSVPGPTRSASRVSRRGWGEAPTYLEAMSSPSYPQDIEANADVPPSRKRTSSGFRDLLARAGLTFSPPSLRPARGNSINMSQRRPESSTSLLLQPQMSRISSNTSITPSSPYLTPWASTHSLPHISSPVLNSAVRASFDETTMPRAGLSDQQMRFLSSSEAVNLVGIKLGDPPARKKRRRSEAGLSMHLTGAENPGVDSPGEAGEDPPTWDEVDEERRRREAEIRRGLARPIDRAEDQDAVVNIYETGALGDLGVGEEGGNVQRTGNPSEPLAAPRAALGSLSLKTIIPSVELVPPTPISPPPNLNSIK
jgi:hypothetical protein